MTVTTVDLVLAVEIGVGMALLSLALSYALREVKRLREQLRSVEEEVKEHRKEIYTGDDR